MNPAYDDESTCLKKGYLWLNGVCQRKPRNAFVIASKPREVSKLKISFVTGLIIVVLAFAMNMGWSLLGWEPLFNLSLVASLVVLGAVASYLAMVLLPEAWFA